MSRRPTTRNPMTRERPILLGFVIQSKGIDGRMEISVRWGRLIGTFILLAVLGWFTLAGALYFHFKYNKEFDQVSYTKMLTLLPFGLENHRVEMGNYHIERGLAEIKEGNYRDALRLIRIGVSRSPANLEGRRVLAEFYEIALKRHDIAVDQLLQGIELGGIQDSEYLKATLRVLLRYQMDKDIQNLANKYLPEEPELTDINRTLAFGAANANYLRGNYDLAEDYIIDYKLLESLEGVLLSAQISWDRGSKIAAITKMEYSIEKFPNSEPLLMQLSRYHRELGEIEEARRYAILRNVSDPLSAAPRLELLYIYNKSEDFEREQLETQRMLQQFRNDEPALQSLANFAADTGNIELARRTYEEALENEFVIDAFALLLIEAHLVDKDYQGALDFSEELLKERPDWLTQRWAIFSSLRAVASYGINRPDLGEIYLQDFIDDASNQAQTYIAVSRRFTDIDRVQQARTILTIAYQKAPTNQKILSELIRSELSLGNTENLSRLLSRYLQMRRPQIELLTEAYNKLGSDRFIFTPDRQSLLLQLNAILRERS
ncbi:MAG: tetratricopeptide repeat protein [Verrucomicrobiota bacterium]|nr:tetratricopeptide repeat protein [Verrucomicrobiota bacterium]